MAKLLSSPDQRTAIFDAAITILAEGGPAALTVRNVAAAAGCSTTGVYTYFGGKNGLVEAIYIDGFTRFDAALRSVERQAGWSALDLLRARAERYRTWALANPTHYLLMFGNSVPDYAPSGVAMEASMRSFTELVAVLTAAVAEGLARGEPLELAYHLWATIHGYVMLELTGRHQILGSEPALRYRAGLDNAIYGVR